MIERRGENGRRLEEKIDKSTRDYEEKYHFEHLIKITHLLFVDKQVITC